MTLIRPFTSKEVMDISFGVGIFSGYKGLEWIWDFHVNHSKSIWVSKILLSISSSIAPQRV
jgi:hypothetical protein